MPDGIPPTPPDSLYEADFFVWTQAQAEALRAAGEAGLLPPGIDWDHLSEEVGDMGKRDLRGAESLVFRILEHLWLLRSSLRDEPKTHWRVEIITFRTTLEFEITPAIRMKLEDGLEALHVKAVRNVAGKLKLLEPEAPAPDPSLRWTLEQILGENDDPRI
jgi:hypothetical protein